MFTGLVEGMGTVREMVPEGPGVRLVIQPPAELDGQPVDIGASIAINGCCLTVVENDPAAWVFQAGSETLSRTNLGDLSAGDRVNIERSLAVGDRIGGHFVQGHVDGMGTIDRIDPEGEWVFLYVRVPEEMTAVMVPKGSITIDGVSLTLVVVERELFSIALIPHTLEVTTLGTRKPGSRVNLENDILGKYVQKLLTTGRSQSGELAGSLWSSQGGAGSENPS